MLSSLFHTSPTENKPTTQGSSQNSLYTSQDFIPLTAEQYDAYLSKPLTGIEKEGVTRYSPQEANFKGPHVYAGPALITLDSTFTRLNVALPFAPNLEMPESILSGKTQRDPSKNYVWIVLSSITTKDGKEALDNENFSEKDIFFQTLLLSTYNKPIPYLSGIRNLHVTNYDMKTIKGTLFFKIPLDSETSTNFYEKSYPFTINN